MTSVEIPEAATSAAYRAIKARWVAPLPLTLRDVEVGLRAALPYLAPAGDGGLREALEAFCADRSSGVVMRSEVKRVLDAHPAASAVPQPVDREALAKWLYEHYDPRGNGTGQHWSWDELSQQTKDQYGRQADAVMALLNDSELKS